MLKLFRTNTWWNAVVPQVLGWVYLLSQHKSLRTVLVLNAFFFVALICISAFGYLFNDYCDIEADRKAGKHNLLNNYSKPIRVFIVLLPLLIGSAAWHLTYPGMVESVLFCLQILALILYSLPPIRLKERGAAGVIADAFYGHVNPVFITIFWHMHFAARPTWFVVLLSVVFVVTVLKGIRNILLHQIDDRKADRRADVQTFVVGNGALGALLYINNVLPYEVLLSIVFTVVVSIVYPPFFVWTLLFFVITYLKFSGWKLRDLPKRQLKFKFLYFLNDYYEGWVPVGFLLLLCIKDPSFFILLILHLILFPGFVTKLWGDIKTIRENFKTEDEY